MVNDQNRNALIVRPETALSDAPYREDIVETFLGSLDATKKQDVIAYLQRRLEHMNFEDEHAELAQALRGQGLTLSKGELERILERLQLPILQKEDAYQTVYDFQKKFKRLEDNITTVLNTYFKRFNRILPLHDHQLLQSPSMYFSVFDHSSLLVRSDWGQDYGCCSHLPYLRVRFKLKMKEHFKMYDLSHALKLCSHITWRGWLSFDDATIKLGHYYFRRNADSKRQQIKHDLDRNLPHFFSLPNILVVKFGLPGAYYCT